MSTSTMSDFLAPASRGFVAPDQYTDGPLYVAKENPVSLTPTIEVIQSLAGYCGILKVDGVELTVTSKAYKTPEKARKVVREDYLRGLQRLILEVHR